MRRPLAAPTLPSELEYIHDAASIIIVAGFALAVLGGVLEKVAGTS